MINKCAILVDKNVILEKELSFCTQYLYNEMGQNIKINSFLYDCKYFAEQIRNKQIDLLIIRRLEQLGGDLSLIQLNLNILKTNKIDLVSINDQVNTIVQGELFYELFEKYTALVKRVARNKIQDGLRVARQNGKPLGRPAVSENVLKKAKELKLQGHSYREIGRVLKLDESTIRKRINKLN